MSLPFSFFHTASLLKQPEQTPQKHLLELHIGSPAEKKEITWKPPEGQVQSLEEGW